jgi:hypothetical protein
MASMTAIANSQDKVASEACGSLMQHLADLLERLQKRSSVRGDE